MCLDPDDHAHHCANQEHGARGVSPQQLPRRKAHCRLRSGFTASRRPSERQSEHPHVPATKNIWFTWVRLTNAAPRRKSPNWAPTMMPTKDAVPNMPYNSANVFRGGLAV